MKTRPDFVVRSILQSDLIAHVAVCVSILAHKIESVTIGQLRRTQRSELCWRRMQLELCGYHHFHGLYCLRYSRTGQDKKSTWAAIVLSTDPLRSSIMEANAYHAP